MLASSTFTNRGVADGLVYIKNIERGPMVRDVREGFRSSIAPWLTVSHDTKAIDFYKSAFGATEVYRHNDPSGGTVVRLSVDGAQFWVSEDPEHSPEAASPPLGGDSVRIILTVADPDALFARALAAGATQIFPVSEGHGWRVGRLADPFGLHWELGHPL
jgi:PhnB protein